MTREPRKNTAASIRTRLLSLAQSKGEDYQRVLGRYAIERFLYRLGRSVSLAFHSRDELADLEGRLLREEGRRWIDAIRLRNFASGAMIWNY